jgi:hypothetical protein
VCFILFYYIDLLERIHVATINKELYLLFLVSSYTREVFYNSFIIKVEVVDILFIVKLLLLISTRVY